MSGDWVRLRFRADPDDPRPVTFPPPGPWWCTGYGDGYSIVVAYLHENEDVTTWWPEAAEVDSTPAPAGPAFNARFPKPDWWRERPPKELD